MKPQERLIPLVCFAVPAPGGTLSAAHLISQLGGNVGIAFPLIQFHTLDFSLTSRLCTNLSSVLRDDWDLAR